MVRPESALRRLMRDTGKLLEPYGFEGDGPTWVCIQPEGVATVGRTRTLRTWTGGQQLLRFGLELNATPTPWWEYCNWRNEQLALSPTPLESATGPGLLPDALPPETTEWWSIRLDAVQQGHVRPSDIESIRAELPRRVHAYARRALRLLEPGRYLEELQALPDPQTGTWEAIVVLLADEGPGPDLDQAVDQLLRSCADTPEFASDVIEYAQARAAARA